MPSSISPLPPASRPKAGSIVYVDGFNFYYGVIKDTGHLWLDIERYFTRLRQDDDLRCIHYFTALVSGPTQADQETYLQALATLPKVIVTHGNYKKKRIKCLVTPCTFSGDRLFSTVEEKRTDVHIALQMLDDAYQNRCDRMILVSGDSDLVPAVNRVKQLGKEVLVYIPARDEVRAHAVELRAAAHRAKTLPLPLLNHSHFPDKVPDGKGGFITKPMGW
jgi:uncharacterized LabA/DUF88 family protein